MVICGVCKNKKKKVARAGMIHKLCLPLATQGQKAVDEIVRVKQNAAVKVRPGVVSKSSCFFLF